MREYATLYDAPTKSWGLIFRDDFEKTWYVLYSGLTQDAVELMLKGTQA